MKGSKPAKSCTQNLRAEASLRYLDQKYRNAYKWLPRLAIEAPDLKPADVLNKLRNRITELRAQRSEHRDARIKDQASKLAEPIDARKSASVKAILAKRRYFWPVPPYAERTSLERAGAMSIADYLAAKTHLLMGDRYQDLLDGASQNRRIEGIARASGFKEYVWVAPEKNDTRTRHLFLPYGTESGPTNFTGATGLQFLGGIEVQPNWFIDEGDSFAFGGVLQYVLPPAPWDGGVEWNLEQYFVLPEMTGEGDFCYCSVVSCARQSPTGENFPSDFERDFSLESLLPVVAAVGEGGEFSGGPFAVADIFRSGFPVSQNQRACVYVGLSVLLMARDGSMSLGDPNIAYHFSPSGPAGLAYAFYRID